jgi:secreted PhoX family phosphatase
MDTGLRGVVAVGFGATFWDDLLAAAEGGHVRRGPGYGPLRSPDEHGIRLPEGFRARVVARGGERVAGTGYVWHEASDGAATFSVPDGGWILVSNSETLRGGASAVRFDRRGGIVDAYRILSGTTQNCSGGATPWGTWLSCEEIEGGFVWECDPTGRKRAAKRPALGSFKHEAAAADPHRRRIYLTEDLKDGCLYRFTPRTWGDLRDGLLEVATVGRAGAVEWTSVPDPSGLKTPTRDQVPHSTRFARAEGIRFDRGVVYLATTADQRVHAYDVRRGRIRVIYDGLASATAPILRPDQIGVSPGSEVFVCEDLATEEIDLGVIDRSRKMSRFLSVSGPEHKDSELTGVTFDPSGRRMYIASQRARRRGAVYEVTGPFRRRS